MGFFLRGTKCLFPKRSLRGRGGNPKPSSFFPPRYLIPPHFFPFLQYSLFGGTDLASGIMVAFSPPSYEDHPRTLPLHEIFASLGDAYTRADAHGAFHPMIVSVSKTFPVGQVTRLCAMGPEFQLKGLHIFSYLFPASAHAGLFKHSKVCFPPEQLSAVRVHVLCRGSIRL